MQFCYLYVETPIEFGPEDVSLLERCPHFRGCYVQASMELRPVSPHSFLAQLQIEEMQTTLESEQKARDQTNRELEQTRTNLREVQCSLDANTKQEHTLKKALDR